MSGLEWRAPASGFWFVDRAHFSRPATAHMQQMFPAFTEGFLESIVRYGWPVGAVEIAAVNGLMYSTIRPLDPADLDQRAAAAERVWANKIWREDVDRWDNDAKPAALLSHRRLSLEEPNALDDAALIRHLRECWDQHYAMWMQHHRFNGAHIVPVGDFVGGTCHWTKLPQEAVAQLLRGAAPVSGGRSPEADAVAEALTNEPTARAIVSEATAATASDALARIQDIGGELGDAVRDWLIVTGYRLIDGFDVCVPYALEQPHLLLAGLRLALARATDVGVDQEALGEVRAAVPEQLRGEFDERYEEARYCYRVRDERGIYSDATAAGLMRRAMLAAGDRLVVQGVLARDRRELAIEATVDELVAMLEGSASDLTSELERRAAFRDSMTVTDAPAFLGDAPPEPSGDLPPALRRVGLAVRSITGAASGPTPPQTSQPNMLVGVGASPGFHRGTARIVTSPDDFLRLEDGDVIVTVTTGEAFNVAIAIASALVTDVGGAFSHAAVTSREFAIPAVVGAESATRLIPDGAPIEVDGSAGTVRWR